MLSGGVSVGSWELGPGFLLWSQAVEGLAGQVGGRWLGRSRMQEAGSVSGITGRPPLPPCLVPAEALTLTRVPVPRPVLVGV